MYKYTSPSVLKLSMCDSINADYPTQLGHLCPCVVISRKCLLQVGKNYFLIVWDIPGFTIQVLTVIPQFLDGW